MSDALAPASQGRRPHRVVYVHNTSKVGGGNKVLLGLFEHINRERFIPVSILPAGGQMEAELAARKVPYHILPPEGILGGRYGVDAVFGTLACTKVLLKERADLLHANSVLTYRYSSLAGRLSGTRRVCHVHHPGEVQNAAWALRVRPNVVITVSGVMLAEVEAALWQLPDPPRIVQITNAVDTRAFVPCSDKAKARQDAGLGGFAFLVTIVGSVNEHKGHPAFLEMARRLLEMEPRAGFLVIGEDVKNDGSYRREMEALTASMGIASSVVFYGFASDELTRTLVAASDIVALPTREEGFGLALAEAQASGVAVVSTRVGPVPEVVADGETGILVSLGDIAGLTNAVVSLLRDPKRRADMGSRGRERAIRLFSQDRYAREMEIVYASLVATKQRSHASRTASKSSGQNKTQEDS